MHQRFFLFIEYLNKLFALEYSEVIIGQQKNVYQLGSFGYQLICIDKIIALRSDRFGFSVISHRVALYRPARTVKVAKSLHTDILVIQRPLSYGYPVVEVYGLADYTVYMQEPYLSVLNMERQGEVGSQCSQRVVCKIGCCDIVPAVVLAEQKCGKSRSYPETVLYPFRGDILYRLQKRLSKWAQFFRSRETVRYSIYIF